MQIALITILVVLAVGLVWVFNRLVAHRNRVSEAWAGIDVQLQKRHELVPNLIAVVKAYAHYESRALEKITAIRSPKTVDPEITGPSESSLSRSIGRLFALAENYPDLKANERFSGLHQQLVDIEKDLQFARRYYNGTVRDNNTLVESFPSLLIARPLGFHSARFFEIEFAGMREPPRVEP